MPSVRIPLSPAPHQVATLREILAGFEVFCSTVRQVAAKHHTRHQAALHALCYRLLCPTGTKDGLPTQFAIRAISRVSHQLRAEALGLDDPYPDRSFDLDSRCASLEPHLQALAISSADGRPFRGRTAQDARLRIPATMPADLPPGSMPYLAGASLVLPRRGKPYLLARYELSQALEAQEDPE